MVDTVIPANYHDKNKYDKKKTTKVLMHTSLNDCQQLLKKKIHYF